MPDRVSTLIFVALVGGSLVLTLAAMPDKIMFPILIALLSGIGLALSPDRSFVRLWRRTPILWRILSFIFVVMVMVQLPPINGTMIGRLLLGIIAISGSLLLLSIANLVFGPILKIFDRDR